MYNGHYRASYVDVKSPLNIWEYIKKVYLRHLIACDATYVHCMFIQPSPFCSPDTCTHYQKSLIHREFFDCLQGSDLSKVLKQPWNHYKLTFFPKLIIIIGPGIWLSMPFCAKITKIKYNHYSKSTIKTV